jgi:hypothetical protein
MPAIGEEDEEYLAELERDYAFVLHAVLRNIFEARPAVADGYLAELADCPPFERLLALHEPPIEVASELTGIPITEEMQLRYEEILRSLAERFTSEMVLARRVWQPQVGVLADSVAVKDVPFTLVERYLTNSGYNKIDTLPNGSFLWARSEPHPQYARSPRHLVTPRPNRQTPAGTPAFSRTTVVRLIRDLSGRGISVRQAHAILHRLEEEPAPRLLPPPQ